jgi:hypothetical protein
MNGRCYRELALATCPVGQQIDKRYRKEKPRTTPGLKALSLSWRPKAPAQGGKAGKLAKPASLCTLAVDCRLLGFTL